jgi:transcriptional regulator with XRE-family HTH domain
MKTNQTHLSNAIAAELIRAGWTQAELAEKTSLTQSSICRAMSSKTDRPRPAILSALIRCWPGPGAPLRVLIAHLRDEINRAGMPQACLDIATPGDHIPGDIARALRTIARTDPNAFNATRDLIIKLGYLIETSDASNRMRQAAEQPSKYQAKKENK